eukprot:TRINITY_DN112597_c0_g1_i1.p1 TRINITY_DN112597_c0_g1~~TRINITY_DN112597_c0_g1_i1.p1  ORF type:complete len:299 (+),score=61.89 TRINITY_DN112597_c0_g1_i1:60-956(+)
MASVDLSGFKKVVTCGGRRYDDFSNFAACRIWAEDDYWPTSEHYYQALKFPGTAGAALRDEIRETASPMECWKLGNSKGKTLLRKDWEVVKLDMMYQANLLKFSQSEHLRYAIVNSEGSICCDGGLFWKTWNEVILERIREELRCQEDRDADELALREALMLAYSSAVASGDQRAADAVTTWASKRKLPPKPADVSALSVSGLVGSSAMVFRADALVPEVNEQPHWISNEGWHLYLGKKNSRCAWVIDECLAENEASGHAFFSTDGDDKNIPECRQTWSVWDDSRNRHMERELVVTAC